MIYQLDKCPEDLPSFFCPWLFIIRDWEGEGERNLQVTPGFCSWRKNFSFLSHPNNSWEESNHFSLLKGWMVEKNGMRWKRRKKVGRKPSSVTGWWLWQSNPFENNKKKRKGWRKYKRREKVPFLLPFTSYFHWVKVSPSLFHHSFLSSSLLSLLTNCTLLLF